MSALMVPWLIVATACAPRGPGGEPAATASAPHRPDTGKGQIEFSAKSPEVVGVYVPGGVPYELQPGQARLLPKGSDLILQMHYTTNGKAGSDRSRVGFIFAKAATPAEVERALRRAHSLLAFEIG